MVAWPVTSLLFHWHICRGYKIIFTETAFLTWLYVAYRRNGWTMSDGNFLCHRPTLDPTLFSYTLSDWGLQHAPCSLNPGWTGWKKGANDWAHPHHLDGLYNLWSPPLNKKSVPLFSRPELWRTVTHKMIVAVCPLSLTRMQIQIRNRLDQIHQSDMEGWL